MNTENILGSWKLLSHGIFNADQTFTPTAESMIGKLIYSNDGSMSVLILKKENATQLSDLIVYSGKFSVNGSKIFHHIEVAPSATRRNTSEVRLAELRGDELILRTEPEDGANYEIRWARERS